jgi:signal transduction histidine kinase
MQFSLNIIMTKEILRNLNFNQEKNTKYKIFEMLQIQDKYNTNKTGKSKESMKDIMEDHEEEKKKNEIQDSLIKLYANMDI